VCVLILFSVVFSSFDTGYGSHIRFYDKEPNKHVQFVLNSIRNQKIFNVFRVNTGLNTGYGFFSPNVASDFLIFHEIYKKKTVAYKKSDWMLQTKEGKHRFSNLNNSFMEFLDEEDKKNAAEKDSLKIKYYKMIVNRLNSYHLKYDNSIDSIRTTIYLYHFPYLSEFPLLKPKLIKIEQQTKKNTSKFSETVSTRK
jgi:hypothetical protein